MNQKIRSVYIVLAITIVSLVSSFTAVSTSGDSNMPWKKAGLTERQAAAHLLNRFTFGARPGDVDKVVDKGLDDWLEEQLEGNLKDEDLNKRLSGYDAIYISNSEAINKFPRKGQIAKMAIKDGYIKKTEIDTNNKEYAKKLEAYINEKGIRAPSELYRQTLNQKILRAAYSNNQLKEVLTDFWFNHFNVAMNKSAAAPYIPAYERDVIRKNALSKFSTLLFATAKSPAMLYYLDNFNSTGTNSKLDGTRMAKALKRRAALQKGEDTSDNTAQVNALTNKAKGLNENYAREVMELHTLGVDGGYSQKDVTEAARILTGWTVYPINEVAGNANIKQLIDRIGEDKLEQLGYVHESDFLFAVNRHDNGEKKVLGKVFPAGGGYQEGVELLTMLAKHQSTAKFISRKIAIRFVNDNPPATLVDKMAKTFLAKDGDIKEVIRTMVEAPEFWSKEALREKTKSPFELAISSVRGLNGEIRIPAQLNKWITKMGQRIYFYQAPTGFPDKGQYWINTGALLNRMNFGLSLATNKIKGIHVDLLALNKGREPESAEEALNIYSKILMPERDLSATIKRLTPLLKEPELEKKIDKAADKVKPATAMKSVSEEELPASDIKEANAVPPPKITASKELGKVTNNMAQVVGIILGSPEFQRR